MNVEILHSEASHYLILADNPKAQCHDIDEETLRDTLEGIGDLPRLKSVSNLTISQVILYGNPCLTRATTLDREEYSAQSCFNEIANMAANEGRA